MAFKVVQRLTKFTTVTNGADKLCLFGFYRNFSDKTKKARAKTAHDIVLPKRVEDITKRSSIKHLQQRTREKKIQVPHIDETTGDVDDFAHTVTTFGSKHSAFVAEREKTKELLSLNSFVRSKTIGRKYFRQPKKTNLLTWACKEQIRFLHEKDPEHWSVEELASKFPISESSIYKILKSRVRLHRVIDIIEHDLFVKRNWEKFHESLLSNSKYGEYDDAGEDILADIGNKENLYNIFPLEEETNSKQLSVSVVPRRRKRLGVFSAMVKDEIERKESENQMLHQKHQEDLNQLRDTMMKVKEILVDSEMMKPSFVEIENNSKLEEQYRKSKQFKKNNDAPIKISVSNNGLKVIDGCVYDEDGDFLYKIP